MEILKASDKKIPESTAVALGMFDGVHLGHGQIIDSAIAYAKANKLKSAIVTLANHPRELVQGEAPLLLTDLDTKLAIFEAVGVDYVLLLDFNEELMNMAPEEYLQRFLLGQLNVKFISVGYDHHFGKARAGTPAMLQEWSKKNGVQVRVCEAISHEGELVSSSSIRNYILAGDIAKANKLLGRDFFLRARVVKGDGRGQELGFPTANLEVNHASAIPALGVYSGRVKLPAGASPDLKASDSVHDCVVNIGYRPTFKDQSEAPTIEVHILDFDKDIYDSVIELSFSKRIRDEVKFSSKEELIQQIEKDIANV